MALSLEQVGYLHNYYFTCFCFYFYYLPFCYNIIKYRNDLLPKSLLISIFISPYLQIYF